MNLLKYFLSLTLILGPYAQAWDQATSKVVQVDQASGVSSTPNYWKSGDAELTLAGVAAYNDGASAKPVDCTGGSSTMTGVRSATNPMYDKFSWLVSKPASNVQGQGIAFEFDVDNGISQVEMMDLMFDYIVNSGTFAAGSDTTNSDLMVYLYDVTAGKLIEPYGGSKLYTSATDVKGDYRGWFQSTLGSKKYRVCLHQATTSASAYTLKVDAGKVQKSKQVVGTIITDWQSFTPVVTHDSGGVTNVTHAGRYRRVGDTFEGMVVSTFSNASAAFVGWRVQIPYTIDLNKLPSNAGLAASVGSAHAYDAATELYPGLVSVRDNTRVDVRFDLTKTGTNPVPVGSSVGHTTPFTFNAGDTITAMFSVPIQGWSAGARMSDGYDGRDIAGLFTGLGSTLSLTTTNQTINFLKVRDESDSYSSGVYTVKTSGWYEAEAGIGLTNLTGASTLGSAVARLTLFMGGESSIYEVNAINTTSLVGTPSLKTGKKAYLIAGQTIYAQARVIGTSAANVTTFSDSNYLTIIKSSGTPFMSPTALWETHYAGTAGDAIGTTDSLIKFTTKVEDTFGSYNPSTGLWTAKGPATCSANWAITSLSVNLSTSQRLLSFLRKTGTPFANGSRCIGNGVSNICTSIGSVQSIKINTGDTLEIVAVSDVATSTDTTTRGQYFTVSCRQSGN